MSESSPPSRRTQRKDGQLWRIGTQADVAWINDGITAGLSVAASVPPVFEDYATLVFPLEIEGGAERRRAAEDRFDDALIQVLESHTRPQPWWLGFLDTGATDVVLPQSPRVRVYGCGYVLIEAGARQARTWRDQQQRWFTALPELIFPRDHSWLLSSLWDDAWASVGGRAELIASLLAHPELSSGAQRTDPAIPDMWPSALPEFMHERLRR